MWKKAISSIRFNKAVDIICTSVDRPDIHLIITPMQRKSVKSFAGLFFTIRNAIDEEKNPTPAAILKTMIFVDSRRSISAAVNQVQAWLLAMSPQYTPDQVRQMVRGYHRKTAKHDQEKIYKEFEKADSEIRIVICTESLGLGVDLSDVF